MIKPTTINKYKIYPFANKSQLFSHLNNGNFNNILVALNAEKVVTEDENLRRLVNENIGYSDGVGVVWALKKRGFSVKKIPGAELWLDIIQNYYMDKSFYLVGSKETIINKTVAQLKQDYPGINIAGYRNGYMNDSELKNLFKDISETQPDIVFVAMGSPKQENVIQKMYTMNKALYMGLGGSFDIYAGQKKRAPKIFRKFGLEWFYRVSKEPQRVWRLEKHVKFTFRLLTNKL